MTLIPSVSGIRGTIGSVQGDNLTPPDIVAFTAAFATWMKSSVSEPSVVIGRDGRISGPHVCTLVSETLRAMGVHVIDTGLSTTPTVEMYVPHVKAHGGIIITASHNPRDWNALKFLNARGEIISEKDGLTILELTKSERPQFVPLDKFGSYTFVTDAIAVHVEAITALPLVCVNAIRQRAFHVVVDCINSTGALAMPQLLDALGCTYTLLHAEVTGEFAHNPEPLEEHLEELCSAVVSSNAAIGVAVDPDVDRLALVDEQGKYFGEEYTLVAVADYILQHTPGSTVSNLSSSRALRDITESYGQDYSQAKVGEVHVVEEMKRTNAVIGGEGNGGVIYPALHYGRDALVGVALILSYLAEKETTLSALKSGYPEYFMVKSKLELSEETPVKELLEGVGATYPDTEQSTIDGLKIIFEREWIHLRASNTEPVIRIYAESTTIEQAETLVRTAQLKLVSLTPE